MQQETDVHPHVDRMLRLTQRGMHCLSLHASCNYELLRTAAALSVDWLECSPPTAANGMLALLLVAVAYLAAMKP